MFFLKEIEFSFFKFNLKEEKNKIKAQKEWVLTGEARDERSEREIAYPSRKFNYPRGRYYKFLVNTKGTIFSYPLNVKTIFFIMERRFAPRTWYGHYFLLNARSKTHRIRESHTFLMPFSAKNMFSYEKQSFITKKDFILCFRTRV